MAHEPYKIDHWTLGQFDSERRLTLHPECVLDSDGCLVATVNGLSLALTDNLEHIDRETHSHVIEAGVMIAKAPEMRAAIKELCACLHDMATGRGGWAWEEVISGAQSILREIESGGLGK